MKKTDKIKFIGEKLDELFPNPPIPLDYTSAYTMLVAVVLSAQCTDIRVNQVTKVLFKAADTPKKMVKLGVERIAEIIKPCGFFNTKSVNIYNLSKTLVEKYDGDVPPHTTYAGVPAVEVGHPTDDMPSFNMQQDFTRDCD